MKKTCSIYNGCTLLIDHFLTWSPLRIVCWILEFKIMAESEVPSRQTESV